MIPSTNLYDFLPTAKASNSAQRLKILFLVVLALYSVFFAKHSFAMTTCPSGFSESARSDTALTCSYLGMVTGDLNGTPPSQTEEGRQLVTEASTECRRVGTVVTAGSVGTNGVTLTCNVPFTPEEIAEIEREEEEEREREEEEEREREEEEERQREEEEERQREEEEERQREEEEADRRREAREERDRQREEEAERQRAELEAIRLEEEARNAPFTFDQPDEVTGRVSESSVASGLVSLCTSLRTESNRTSAQTDLLERCIDINREESNSAKASALGQLAAKQYADIGQSLAFLNTIQVGNIGGRLAAITPTLRQNSKDVASSDLAHPDQGLLASSANTDAQVGGAAGDNNGRFGVFILGTKGDGEKDASLLSNGFDYQSESMTFGIDYMFNASTVVGLAYGYGKTDSEFTGRTGRMDIDSETVTLYGAKALRNNFTFDAIVGLGDISTDSERRMNFTAHGKQVDQLANSTINSDQKLISIGFTKSYETFLNIDIGARFNYIETDINRFSEEIDASAPGFGLALEIDDYKLKSSTSDLNMNLSKAFSTNWGVLIPQARLSWVHEFESGDRVLRGRFLADTSTLDFRDSGLQLSGSGGSTLFNVPLEQLDADYGSLLLGINALLPNQFSVNASLNKTLGIRDFDHTYWSLSARKDF